MSIFNNPIVLCGSIALGIVLILVFVVVLYCKKSSKAEREELMELSHEIELDLNNDDVETIDNSEEQKIENVLSMMQEALDTKTDSPITFEQEQEENAIISYQELLDSLGAKNSIDVDSIEVYDDELDNQIEISDFNKEIIDSYQNDNLSKEIFRFQNDYSNEGLASEIVDDSPVMNFDFNAENVKFSDDSIINESPIDEVVFNESDADSTEVYQARHVEENTAKKFKRTEFISPVYGIIRNDRSSKSEEVEEIIFDDDSLLD